MRNLAWIAITAVTVWASAAFADVNVAAPANGATLQGPVVYSASATSSCPNGVGSMGIYTSPGVLAYVTSGSNLNTTLNLSPGTYATVVQEWDNCGGSSTAGVFITVTNQSGVYVTSPGNNSNVTSPVKFAATSTTSCSKGVGGMGIYTSPGVLAFVVKGSTLNTNLVMNPGNYNTTIIEWDNCGGAATAGVQVNVIVPPGVNVTSPANNGHVTSPVAFTASATTACNGGVAGMGIYTAPGVLAYSNGGANLNTNLDLNPGTYNAVVEEWDNCGGAATSPVTITVGAQSEVDITSPANNSVVGSPVTFSATATTSCAKGIQSMGIYTATGQLAYVASGSSLNTNLSLDPGVYNAVVEEWDRCGGAATSPVTITVENSFGELQSDSGWTGYGQGPPNFIDCRKCGPQISWTMTQDVQSPSLSGSATEFTIGGTGPYWDALFNNHLIGDQTSQGLPDSNHKLVPTLHNFTYDVYFYGTSLNSSQALEFDINQFFDNMGFIWGHECRIAGGNEWDIWDNANARWVATGITCNPKNNSWNHLTIQVQRTSGNQLLYQSITLNGVTSMVNHTYNPGSTSGWWGVTVNYQMDGNYVQSPYSIYLDNLTFLYQ